VQGRILYRIFSLCVVRGVKDDGQRSLPIFSPQWGDQAFWMPFTSSQRLQAAAFHDVLIYRCLCIDCAVLYFAVSNLLRGGVGVPSRRIAVALCRSMIKAQRTRHFP
jgi:hypothetical protein